jgi:ankyrin repeat protein
LGRTPLHIACARNDPQSVAIIEHLISHSANPNVICNGYSPLALAIASGNKEAIDLLLNSEQCDLNMRLSDGIGSALCVISSTLYEHNWSLSERIKLVRYCIQLIFKQFNRQFSIIFYLLDRQTDISRSRYITASRVRLQETSRHCSRLCLLYV